MWSRQQTNGKYKFTESYKDPITGRFKEVSVTVGGNTKMYQAQARAILTKKIQQKTSPQEFYKNITFEAVANEWLEEYRVTLAESTYIGYQTHLKRLKKLLPDNILLRAFDVNQLRTLNNKLIEEEYTKRTIEGSIEKVKRIIQYAYEKGYISYSRDIAQYKVRYPPLSEKDVLAQNSKYLEYEEVIECLQQLRAIDRRIALAVEFQVRTGVRIGELLALRERDYYKSTTKKGIVLAKINVNGTMDYHSKKRNPPKTKESIRDIVLNDRTIEILDTLIEENHYRKSISNNKEFNEEGYIFITLNESITRRGRKGGKPYDSKTINDKLKLVNVNNKKLTSHVFRHTHSTLLAERGVDPKTVQQRMGHKDSKITMDIYTHVTNQMRDSIKDLKDIT